MTRNKASENDFILSPTKYPEQPAIIEDGPSLAFYTLKNYECNFEHTDYMSNIPKLFS